MVKPIDIIDCVHGKCVRSKHVYIYIILFVSAKAFFIHKNFANLQNVLLLKRILYAISMNNEQYTNHLHVPWRVFHVHHVSPLKWKKGNHRKIHKMTQRRVTANLSEFLSLFHD